MLKKNFNLTKYNKYKYFNKFYFNIKNSNYSSENNKIIKFFNQFNLEYKIRTNGQIILKYCNFCNKPHHDKNDNLFVLNFKSDTGVFYCFRCGNYGNWYDFVGKILEKNGLSKINNNNTQITNLKETHVSKIKIAEEKLLISQKNLKNLSNTGNIFIKYLTEERKLNIETLQYYDVDLDYILTKNENDYKEIPSIFFPYYYYDKKKNEINFLKYKNKELTNEFKNIQKFYPSGLPVGFFGLNILKNFKKDLLIITEGEYDAMSIHQITKIPTISLPNGASNLPIEIKDITDNYKNIILWMDFDEAGQINIEKFSQKIGINKTHIVRIDDYCLKNKIKDPNELLIKNPKNIIDLINKATPIPRQNILTFESLRSIVKDRIIYGQNYKGSESFYFPWFNKYIKGLRRGELTILTGQTGTGKTTFLSQYSLDFAIKGVPTLWCSFELKNEVLLSTMLNQFANTKIDEENFDELADEFQELPILFQTFFGSTEIDKVIYTIEYAIYTYDISHIILDNLQFMISGQGRGFEKFDIQDEIVSKLRKWATNQNIHITLVIHPKKSEETQDLSVNSIFGTAKSTQESDNIFIIQQREKYRVIDIKKNRYDGEIGKVALWFDKETKKFFELKIHEIEQLMDGKNWQFLLKKKREETDLSKKHFKNTINLDNNKFIDNESFFEDEKIDNYSNNNNENNSNNNNEISSSNNNENSSSNNNENSSNNNDQNSSGNNNNENSEDILDNNNKNISENNIENNNLNKNIPENNIKNDNIIDNNILKENMNVVGLNGQTIDVEIDDNDTCDDVLEKQLNYFEKNIKNENKEIDDLNKVNNENVLKKDESDLNKNEENGIFNLNKKNNLVEPNFYDEEDEAPNYEEIKNKIKQKTYNEKNKKKSLEDDILENYISDLIKK